MRTIERNNYLNELVSLRANGMVKVITGMRRCGKSYLLFELFTSLLKEEGVADDHVIKVDLEDYENRSLRNPDNLYAYIKNRIAADNSTTYVLLDAVRFPEMRMALSQ